MPPYTHQHPGQKFLFTKHVFSQFKKNIITKKKKPTDKTKKNTNTHR